MRLNSQTRAMLPASIAQPSYDRSQVTAGIVHLGLGAFHRAHQALFTEAALAAGDLSWGIVGAGLISPAMREALEPQDGLYTLAVSDPAGERYQLIGSLVEVLGGAEDNPRLIQWMVQPQIRIVSLTVTEKGYHLHSATGELNFEAPLIAADVAQPRQPQTVPGLIVEALRQRRAAGIAPFTVLSCDNLPSNGAIVKRAVIAFARRVDAELAQWIEAEVAFPSTMVDRITPATTDADKARIAGVIGMDDAWPVVTEPFCQWVVEDHFPLGRPKWELGGAIFSNEIEAWEQMKLRCLNGAHSTLAYMGQLLGLETVADTMASARLMRLIQGLWQEIIPTLHAPAGADPQQYVLALQERFRNPAIRHKTAQIAMDGSQKLPQRLLAPLRQRLASGEPSVYLETAVAAWMAYVYQTVRAGGVAALKDPMTEEIARALGQPATADAHTVVRLLGIEAIFGCDLPQNAALVLRLQQQFALLQAEFAL